MSAFIDYISFTIKRVVTDMSDAVEILNRYAPIIIEDGELQGGLNGYLYSVAYPCGARVLFHGLPSMGTHIILPGKALDNAHVEFDVFELIARLRRDKVQYNISRVDIAIDTDLDFGYFYNKFVRRQFVCRYNSKNLKKHVDINNRGTLYFGKRGSLTMIRIYDKAYEQGLEGEIWTRIEMECREEACEQALEALKKGTINQYFLGHLRFVNKRCSDMSKAVTAKKYLEVLSNPMARRRFRRDEGSDNTLEWFRKQVAPTIKALERDYGQAYIRRIIDESKISLKQARQRFKIRVIDGMEVNVVTGEIVNRNPKGEQLTFYDYAKAN